MFKHQLAYEKLVLLCDQDRESHWNVYLNFDKRGVPTTDSHGVVLSKIDRKRVERMYKNVEEKSKFLFYFFFLIFYVVQSYRTFQLSRILAKQKLHMITEKTSTSTSSKIENYDAFISYSAIENKIEPNLTVNKIEINKHQSSIDDSVNKLETNCHGETVQVEALKIEFQDLNPLLIIGGTFGNRQGIEINSELGPSTHIFSFT